METRRRDRCRWRWMSRCDRARSSAGNCCFSKPSVAVSPGARRCCVIDPVSRRSGLQPRVLVVVSIGKARGHKSLLQDARADIRAGTDDPRTLPVSFAPPLPPFAGNRPMTSSSLAFVFPGQGSQSLGMLGELAARDALVQDTFREASDGADVDLWMLAQSGPEEMLNRTEFTQPALLAAGVAVWRAWQARGGTQPAMLAGHSLGEYTALVAAGALSLRDAAQLVRHRGQLMQDASPAGTGAMAAVLGAEDDVVRLACEDASGDAASDQGIVVPANYNSPGQI